VRRLEIRAFFCSFDWLLSFDKLKRVFLVGREFLKGLVVASLGWVCRLERLIMKRLMR
jgi:hypothetical protein